MTRMTQNKNDSVNSILQRGFIVDYNCCVVFLTLRFPYLTLCSKIKNNKIRKIRTITLSYLSGAFPDKVN